LFLNEPDWLEAIPIGDILQRDPHPGAKASEQTEQTRSALWWTD
jgi:hypothetical protein